MPKIAETISRFRKQQNLAQEKLARLAGVSNNTLINIETSKNPNYTIATLKKIAKALRISVDKLL